MHSLDDVRAVSDEARSLLEEYLREHAHVLTTGYDLTALTLGELPDLGLSSIMTATPPPIVDEQSIAADLRVDAKLPAAHQEEFDRLLSDAVSRDGHARRQRPPDRRVADRPAPTPAVGGGEAARRPRRLATTEHVFETTPVEVLSLFSARGRPPTNSPIGLPGSAERLVLVMTPPMTLGDPEPEPPLGALPRALVERISMVQVSLKYMGMDGATIGDPMTGTEIGASSYVGRACVASSADDAIERLQPGDVLVVRATSPAFKAWC